MAFRRLLIVVATLGFVSADVYLHIPRGSNNRANEQSANRQNANRMFDSQVFHYILYSLTSFHFTLELYFKYGLTCFRTTTVADTILVIELKMQQETMISTNTRW